MKHLGRRPFVWILAFALAAAANASADTVSIGPKKNNTIYSESENTNGGGRYFFAGTTQHNAYRRAIVSFDVAGNVPAGSTIESATLTLHMSRTNPGAQPVMVHLRRCLRPWGEGTVIGPVGEGGGGSPHEGDATWSFNMYNTSRWSSPGGDFSSASSGSTLVSNPIAFYTWSSPQMAQDIQSWLDADEANFGWVLVADGEGAPPVTAKRFDSRNNLSAQFRPVLTIVYSARPDRDGGVPDPGNGRRDAGGGVDAGEPDAGFPEDAGIGMNDAGPEEGPVQGPRPDRNIDELGHGCQAAPGSALGLLALTLIALRFRPRA